MVQTPITLVSMMQMKPHPLESFLLPEEDGGVDKSKPGRKVKGLKWKEAYRARCAELGWVARRLQGFW